MGRIFEIVWPDFDLAVAAELFDTENPELCDYFWSHLPFETVFAASMSAGEMFKVPIPFTIPKTPSKTLYRFPDLPPGSIVHGGFGGLLLRYGVVVEPFVVPRLAQIPDADVTKLRDVAYKLRDAYFFSKEINFATFRRQS